MNTRILFEWVKGFDLCIEETRNSKALLLVDNASYQGTSENVPKFFKYWSICLSQKSTSKLQPFDSGIVVTLKRHHRPKQISTTRLFRKNSKSIYNVSQLRTTKYLKEIWENVNEEILFNSWCKSNLDVTPNSVFLKSEQEGSSEIRDIETNLPNMLHIQFHSNLNELLILKEYDSSRSFN